MTTSDKSTTPRPEGQNSAGEYIPNSFQTPNVLVDKLMPLLTPTEFVVLMFAVRHILGWRKRISSRKAAISLSMFERTGLNRATIVSVLDELSKYGLLRKVGEPTPKGQMWALDFEKINLSGLVRRSEEKDRQRQHQTEKGRKTRGEVVCSTHWYVEQTGTGLSNRRNQTQSLNTIIPPLSPNGGTGEGSDHSSNESDSGSGESSSSGKELNSPEAGARRAAADPLDSVARKVAQDAGFKPWYIKGAGRFFAGEDEIRAFVSWYRSAHESREFLSGAEKLPADIEPWREERRKAEEWQAKMAQEAADRRADGERADAQRKQQIEEWRKLAPDEREQRWGPNSWWRFVDNWSLTAEQREARAADLKSLRPNYEMFSLESRRSLEDKFIRQWWEREYAEQRDQSVPTVA